MKFDYPFKAAVLMTTAFAVTLFGITNSSAQSGGGSMLSYLQTIAANTTAIASDMTTYVDALATAWTQPDQSDTTSSLTTNVIGIGNLITQELTQQMTDQTKINSDLLNGATTSTLSNANDLVYSSILGSPYFTKDPRGTSVDYAYNYIKNAGGISITHTMPNNSWQGANADVQNYQNYYNTVMAVESFNGFILSSQYVDKATTAKGSQPSPTFNSTQQALITWINTPPSSSGSGGGGGSGQSSSFLSQVAGEPIGLVLRQLLVIESQVFILLTQLLQTQKQIATSHAMTNSLLILSNKQYENVLMAKAQGVRPQ